MAYQSPYAGAMAAQNKKKKPPSRGANTPPDMPPPQTYAQPGAGVPANQDPLVAAIAGGATGGGLGANNQAANMPPGVGGNVDTSTTTTPPSRGANTPPAMPPPPPPPGNLTATTVNPTSNPSNFASNAATTVNPTSDPNFGQPPATTVNPTSDPNFGKQPATMVNPTSDPNFGRPPATTVNPTSDPNFGKPPATTVNPTSDPNFGRPPATMVNPTSDPNFGKPPATTVNPTSDPNFGKQPATMVNPTSDPNFGKPPATTVNPTSDPNFVSNLAGGQPVTQNPLSDPLVVRAMEEERMSQRVTENPLSDPGFVKDLAEGRSNQPITENPLSDPSFVQGLAADATTPTVNPISDPSFVQELAADATTPTDIAGAGADMAAAQNVVAPEAEPMPGTLEDALRQQYMSRVGGTDDPILASQLADQQMRQNEQRKALVEQLGRYGVLRGGGDTAAALARMGEGDERNRLALEAQAAQRRQQDLRDAQGFDLGQRGMGLQEDRSQQDTLTQALNRDIARAGQTGIFERGETMASRRQDAELDALRRGQERADAGLTGQFGDGQTLQAQRQEADIFGEVDGRQTLQSDIQRGQLGLGERQTGLSERTGAEDIRRSATQRGAIEGQEGRAERQLDSQLFGEVDGRQTLTGETTRSGLDTQDLQRRVAEAGQTGRFDFGDQRGTTETQQAKALASELDTAALGRDATRAGMTGQFEGEDTLEKSLREAGLTGVLGEGEDAQATLAGRQADMDLIGSILAAREVDDMAGTEDLVGGLAQNLQSFTPESIDQIRRGAAARTDTSKIETGSLSPTVSPDGITVPSTGNETIDAAMDSFVNREDFGYDPETARGFRTARDSKGDLIAEWVVGFGSTAESFRGKFDKKSGEFVKIGGAYGGSKDKTGPGIDEVDPPK